MFPNGLSSNYKDPLSSVMLLLLLCFCCIFPPTSLERLWNIEMIRRTFAFSQNRCWSERKYEGQRNTEFSSGLDKLLKFWIDLFRLATKTHKSVTNVTTMKRQEENMKKIKWWNGMIELFTTKPSIHHSTNAHMMHLISSPE